MPHQFTGFGEAAISELGVGLCELFELTNGHDAAERISAYGGQVNRFAANGVALADAAGIVRYDVEILPQFVGVEDFPQHPELTTRGHDADSRTSRYQQERALALVGIE